MIIPIGSDHAGFRAKEFVKTVLEKQGHMPVDYGTHTEESVDYPDVAAPVAQSINEGDYELGILICGSGQGVCMTANKFPRVRASLVWNTDIARMTRLHNNANLLCLPGRYLSETELETIVTVWLETAFEGGRHERRVKKIEEVTKNLS